MRQGNPANTPSTQRITEQHTCLLVIATAPNPAILVNAPSPFVLTPTLLLWPKATVVIDIKTNRNINGGNKTWTMEQNPFFHNMPFWY